MTSSVCPASTSLRERGQQLRDVVEVQAGRRLVEDVEQPLAAERRQVRGDLDALRLAARQRRRRLAEPQVAEADLVEHLQAAQHLRRRAEEGRAPRARSCRAPGARSCPGSCTSSTCGLKRMPSHCSHGTKTSARNCISTRTSPSPWHASQRPPGTLNEKWLAVRPRAFASLVEREQLADRIERLEIGHRIRARRAADRRLIDQHDVGDVLESLELAERADAPIPVALRALDRGVEHVVHERRLARAADAGHAGQRVQRNLDVDVLQVVLGRAHAAGSSAPMPLRRGDGTGIASSLRRYFAVSERGSCSSPAVVARVDDACRPARRRRGRCRRCDRRRGSCPRRARRRARCCPGRAAAAGCR